MFRSNKMLNKPEEAENPFFLSFSDLMAGLLAIFILVLIVTLVELEKRKEELRVSKIDLIGGLEEIQKVQNGVANSLIGVSRREQALVRLLEEIKENLKKQGVEVKIAENGTVLRIPEDQLQFALGKYTIPPTHAKSAKAIGQALLTSLHVPENRSLLDTVFLEGHTDSVANTSVMGNWGLSTYRAISLWKFWTANSGDLVDLKNLQTIPADPKSSPKPLISVSGYADTRSTHGLQEGIEIGANRPEDRRIDIRFTLAASEKKELEGLDENLKRMREKTLSLIEKLKATDNDG